MCSKIKLRQWIKSQPSKIAFFIKGHTIRTRIERASAITPPNLLGIDRKIA